MVSNTTDCLGKLIIFVDVGKLDVKFENLLDTKMFQTSGKIISKLSISLTPGFLSDKKSYNETGGFQPFQKTTKLVSCCSRKVQHREKVVLCGVANDVQLNARNTQAG